LLPFTGNAILALTPLLLVCLGQVKSRWILLVVSKQFSWWHYGFYVDFAMRVDKFVVLFDADAAGKESVVMLLRILDFMVEIYLFSASSGCL
jgi:hypothetical protein